MACINNTVLRKGKMGNEAGSSSLFISSSSSGVNKGMSSELESNSWRFNWSMLRKLMLDIGKFKNGLYEIKGVKYTTTKSQKKIKSTSDNFF